MTQTVLLLGVVLPALVAAALWYSRRYRHRGQGQELSPVSRQHIELFQGGQLNSQAIEAAKRRFAALLQRGEIQKVEASLRAGMHYAVYIRALSELGTE